MGLTSCNHSTTPSVTFSTPHVCSLGNKVVAIKQLRIDANIEFLCSTEIWQKDGDGVSIQRLRQADLQVLECAWQIRNSVKYGCAAVLLSNSLPSTFEHVCTCISSCAASRVKLLIYWPSSQAITLEFFTELAKILKYLLTLAEQIVLTGNVQMSNLRVTRAGMLATSLYIAHSPSGTL